MKKQTRSVMITSGAVALALWCSGCAVADWFLGKTSNAEVEEMDQQMAESMTVRKTPYDDSLKNFGKMLEAYNIGEVRVQSKIIANQTAEKELPDDISKLLISALNKIGRKVVYIPYDPNYVINESNTGGNIARTLPQIVLSGGITEFDKDLIEKSRELKSDVNIQKGDFGSNYSHDGGAAYDAESSISRITLDLQLLDYRTQAYMPGIQAINSANIRKTKLGWGVGYFFQGSGLAFQYSLQQKQGKYQALRLLVELSALEVMGKYFDVPYWRCVEGMGPDTAMIARLEEEFAGLDPANQNVYLKDYLFFHGIDGFDRSSAAMSPVESAILAEEVKKAKCDTTAQFFVKLWSEVPLDAAASRNREAARNAAREAAVQAAQPGAAGGAPNPSAAASAAGIEMQQKVAQYNDTISRADALYTGGKLAEAREAYHFAHQLFPDQQDPVDMINRIGKELSAVAATPVQATETAAAPSAAEAKPRKEVPLAPLKPVQW
jgi:curli biogenesis system outer membrane secretion channel CsgG